MKRSDGRMLTTHAGSLPRPRELTRLYALRANGQPIDEAAIDHAGREAVRATVRKQREAGIDIGNNGEQQRESFFLYLRHRLSGLGGSWERPSRAILVAGVIDSLTNFVEHPEVVADRIERVAAVVGDPSRVLAGTDCGFDTSAGWGRVAEDVVWAKLMSLRDGARIASERLFPCC
jgi:methionine synthase II (cobalamin-independent)